jgi:hypothetical protein
MSEARELFIDILQSAINYKKPFRDNGSAISYASDQTYVFPVDFRFNLKAVGFGGLKWEDLINSYLEPRGFKTFLEESKSASISKEKGYACPSSLDHSNCLIGFTYNGKRLSAFSRTCLWVPTGIYDLALLTNVAKLIKAQSIHWKIGCTRLTHLKSGPSLKVMGMSGPFIENNKIPMKGYGSLRAKKFMERGSKDLDGELPDVLSYLQSFKPDEKLIRTMITPDSLAKLGHVRGVDIRNFLRDELQMRKYANYFSGDRSAYRWFTYSDPIVRAIMAKFDIRPPV